MTSEYVVSSEMPREATMAIGKLVLTVQDPSHVWSSVGYPTNSWDQIMTFVGEHGAANPDFVGDYYVLDKDKACLYVYTCEPQCPIVWEVVA